MKYLFIKQGIWIIGSWLGLIWITYLNHELNKKVTKLEYQSTYRVEYIEMLHKKVNICFKHHKRKEKTKK